MLFPHYQRYCNGANEECHPIDRRSGVTFTVDETIKKENVQTIGKTIEERSKNLLQWEEGFSTPFNFLKIEEENKGEIVSYYQNGFIGAALKAYSNHHRLILSPDEVWIAITTAFGRYVAEREEEFRKFFVQHEGKKELIVDGAGSIFTVDWDILIGAMSQKIKENTIGDIQEWIEPNFSTTTPLTKTIGSIVLMGTLKNYFKYTFVLSCGLPEVTLLGTLDDWIEIRRKIDRLEEFGGELKEWHSLLAPILDQFISSYKGNVDKNFWNRIVNEIGGGSGPRYLSGWILCFVPFNEKGEFQIKPSEEFEWGKVDAEDVVPSTSFANVLIIDNGVEFKTVFYAGHLSAVRDEEDQSAVRSNLGWLMIHLLEEEPGFDKHKRKRGSSKFG